MTRTVRIGCAAGFWGDSALAVPQLLTVPGLQYLVFDYLAETTMAILQRARMKDPALGYATDFVSDVVAPYIGECMRKGVRLVANAGGLNPRACGEAVRAAAAKAGVVPRIAVVTGDDVLHDLVAGRMRIFERRSSEVDDARLLSANAYLGAAPICAALAAGADIVITGRCVDSAVTLGVAAFEFGWRWDDWDRLAQGSLAGHLIECGPQATGGLFTDWEEVPGWDNIGYPCVDIAEDGTFVLSKPAATGGLVKPAVVAEQLLYELGDPARYVLPDVVCDFRFVRLAQAGADRVRVSGARGLPATPFYKVCATYKDGYQIQIMMAIRGLRVTAKAARTAQALLERTRRQMSNAGMADYTAVCTELLGQDSQYPPDAARACSRELVLRIAAHHRSAAALAFLQKESTTAGSSMGPGTRSNFGGRAKIQSVVKLDSFLIEKSSVAIELDCDGKQISVAPAGSTRAALQELPDVMPTEVMPTEVMPVEIPQPEPAHAGGELVQVPLERLAWARSGDKGDEVNIGVIAREPRWLPWIAAGLEPQRLKRFLSHLVQGEVQRYYLPGIGALNFVLHEALGGGGTASLRSDPLGKSFAQMLLGLSIELPAELLAPQLERSAGASIDPAATEAVS